MAVKNETELYAPVKLYFEQLGYEVRGEVNHCDLVAIRGDEPPVVVELKKSFSVPLLVQGIQRLTLTDQVYLAFEMPAKRKAPHRLKWNEVEKLCRMLGLGLLTVQFYKTKKPLVELLCHPVPYAPRKNKHRAERLVTEFKERSGDYNVGGATRVKLLTAYREKALTLAHLLKEHGPLSPKQLKAMTGGVKTSLILQHNYYRWFARKQRGIYEITPLGLEALKNYDNVLSHMNLPAVDSKIEK